MENVQMKKTYLSVAITISLLIAGCGGKSAEEHYAAANELAAKQQFNAAVIELKSAISSAPENADYRLLLGRVYIQTGDFFSAEKEFMRALENGSHINDVALELLQSSYRAENYKAVLTPLKDESNLDQSLQRYAIFYRAMSEIEMGTADTSITAFDQLIDAPEKDLHHFAQAILQVKNNAAVEALTELTQIPENSPIAVEILLFNAQLKLTTGQTSEAIDEFYQYLRKVPTALRTRLAVAQLQLKELKLDEADEQLNLILRAAPEHGLTNYLKAMISFERKEFNSAKEQIDKAIANRFNTTASRILAGLIYHQLDLNSQAMAHLSSVQTQLGVYPPAQRLLTALQLQAGEITQAAGSLSNNALTADDISLASATAFRLIRAGETTLANDIIKRIEESGLNEDSQTLSALAQLKMGIPEQMSSAMRDLERALLLDPARHDARLTLAASYIRQQQFDKAAALADEWLSNPETANAGYNLKAMTALITKNVPEAERLLEQATLADDKNAFTHYLLAAVAQQHEDIDKALEFLNEAIQLKPDYVPALFGIYSIYKNQNLDIEFAVKRIQDAQKLAPQNQPLFALLISVYQQEQRHDDIVSLLEPRLNTPEQMSPLAYATLTNAYAVQQKLPQALAITERWYKQDERNQQAALAYANALALSKRPKDSMQIIDTLLRRTPNDNNLKLIKFALLTEQNEHSAALSMFEQLPKEMTTQPQLLFQKGRLQLLTGQLTPGIATLQEAYNKNPDPVTAIAIAEAMAKDISFRRAVRFLEEHMEKYGNTDTRLYGFYGSLLIQDDITKAQDIYKNIAEQQPENPLVLNNYAWVLAESGATAQALPHIEKAVKLQPQHPDILDTYGKVLMLQGDNVKAITQFEKSLAVRQNHPEVMLNYAEALIKQGNIAKAKETLSKVKADSAEHKARLQQLSSSI